jgi:NAD(P)-dependent dehydrogenase (short-subunit alcohol dehydrogenase family)
VTDHPWDRGGDPGRRLEGKAAFVTGAGTGGGDLLGIGEAIAVLFAAQGARVGIVDISRERAESTEKLVNDVGGECVVAVGDLTDLADNARCVEEVAGALGRLDTLVNCAAITAGGGSPVDVDLALWDAAMAVNLTASVLATRFVVPHMRDAGGGAIINVASIAATRGHGSGAYAASKGALIALTRDWAYLHGRDGIRVNCIIPGHVYTPMGNQGGDDLRQLRRRAGLLGTEGDAWDVAWPAVFLASDESRWITGVELPVDAGTTSSGPLALDMLNQRRPV